MRFFILNSKYLGSNRQLFALAECLNPSSPPCPLNSHLRSRSPFLHPMLRLAVSLRQKLSGHSRLSRFLLFFFLKGDRPRLDSRDILIVKTPPFEYPAILLAAGTNARILFVGNPKRVNPKYFTWILSTPSTPCSHANIVLETLPTSFTFKQFCQESKYINQENKWCLLIGGDSRGIQYSVADWEVLLQKIILAAERSGIRWSVSTSPRTNAIFESMLEKARLRRPDVFDDICLWNRGERADLVKIVSGCRFFVVTEDSASMLCDAVNSRCPVVSLRPGNGGVSPLGTPLATYHSARKRVLRLNIPEFDDFKIRAWASKSHKSIDRCWTESLRSNFEKIAP